MTFFDNTIRAAKPHQTKATTAQHSNTIADLEALAQLLDARWKIPGTSIRFGVDALAGLVPLVGDAATGLVSAYIVMRARDHGASKVLIARMVGNVVVDMDLPRQLPTIEVNRSLSVVGRNESPDRERLSRPLPAIEFTEFQFPTWLKNRRRMTIGFTKSNTTARHDHSQK